MTKINRREFIKQSACTAAALAAGWPFKALGGRPPSRNLARRKVIVIGLDGMDPRLCERLMAAGKLPNLNRLRRQGGYRPLGTSDPPQSPVAWANFINGAGPGSHGIFDFIHRDPERQVYPFFAMAETVPGEGYLEYGDHKIQLDFPPFNHRPAQTLLKRQGVPFWDYLDKAGVPSTFYDLPSNYPPSPSKYGNHRCLAGMGTPDLLGAYGTYQHFAEDGPRTMKAEGGGIRSRIYFDNDTSSPLTLQGPSNTLLKEPAPAVIDFVVHRDRSARAAVIRIQDRTIVLNEREWSDWIRLTFQLSTPAVMPTKKVTGICRFYLQEVSPNFRLYVSPINADPADPAIRITEPANFSRELAAALGMFYTTGFQEDHKALSNKVFEDDEFVRQAEYVLEERLNLLDYALNNYDEGLLFFYFSSTDMQAHMLWWDTAAPHPYRSPGAAKKYFAHLQKLYTRMDGVIGDLLKRYGNTAHLIVMSDHGFANFVRQFNPNTWLQRNGYLGPPDCSSVLEDADWSRTRAFALGINSIYLNLKGRECYGIVEPGEEREQLLTQMVQKLEALRDHDGRRIICKVHRVDHEFEGQALKYAPDLIIGYNRDFRTSWKSCLGTVTPEMRLDNNSAWAADHCMDSSEVPGVLFSNRPIAFRAPTLIDLAPSILTIFGRKVPRTMTGRNIF
ncbi:MAG: twin-arginine translocation signal domain-containing protein [Deltaproteobacteria bacterium]|nr:twin-arginine translocation signal domain-containing protein [Deltaproteobacteria bacterium]